MATESIYFRDLLDEAPAGSWLVEDAPKDTIPDGAMSPIAAMRMVTNELAVEGIPERNLATAPPNHSNRVTFDERAMATGMAIYSAVAIRHLEG